MRQIYIALLVPIALVLVGVPLTIQWRAGAGPNTIAEAVAVAEKNGLYASTFPVDEPDAKRVIISALPLDDDEAALVNLSVPRSGTVSCYVAWESMKVHFDPAHCAYWGGMFVHGDPAVVNALTGANLPTQ